METVPISGKPDRNKRESCEMGCGNKVKFQDIGIHGKIANGTRGTTQQQRDEIYDTAREYSSVCARERECERQ